MEYRVVLGRDFRSGGGKEMTTKEHGGTFEGDGTVFYYAVGYTIIHVHQNIQTVH